MSERCQNQEEVLRLLQNQHASSKKQADNIGEISRRVDAQERRTQSLLNTVGNISASIGELRGMFVDVSRNVVELQVNASNTPCFRCLDPTKELPLIIEDALGRKLPIASQWLESLEWEVSSVLVMPGHSPNARSRCLTKLILLDTEFNAQRGVQRPKGLLYGPKWPIFTRGCGFENRSRQTSASTPFSTKRDACQHEHGI